MLASPSEDEARTNTSDANGNLTGIDEGGGKLVTMAYDDENRMIGHYASQTDSFEATAYDGDGLKKVEIAKNGARTTLIWDGTEYLQERAD